MQGTVLAVGDPARRRAGLVIIASLALAAVFAAVTVLSKETPALDTRQPWHDDPYDVLVSLDFVVLPLLVAIGVLRMQLCRRYKQLPARRLVDLLRVSGAALGVCLVTEVAEWASVALGRHRATWTAVTYSQVVVLAVLTAATIGVCVCWCTARLVSWPLSHVRPPSPTGSLMALLSLCAQPGFLGGTGAGG